jgi:hypothetical protein
LLNANKDLQKNLLPVKHQSQQQILVQEISGHIALLKDAGKKYLLALA